MNVQEKNLTASQLHKRKNEKQISPQKPKLNYLTHTHTHTKVIPPISGHQETMIIRKK